MDQDLAIKRQLQHVRTAIESFEKQWHTLACFGLGVEDESGQLRRELLLLEKLLHGPSPFSLPFSPPQKPPVPKWGYWRKKRKKA